MHVRDIMTENPACCTPDTNLQEVARMMVENNCGCIPVVEDQDSRMTPSATSPFTPRSRTPCTWAATAKVSMSRRTEGQPGKRLPKEGLFDGRKANLTIYGGSMTPHFTSAGTGNLELLQVAGQLLSTQITHVPRHDLPLSVDKESLR